MTAKAVLAICLRSYLDNKSSLPKVIEWFETNSRIHVLKPQDYTKMEYFLTRGPNVFIAKLPLEKEELKKIMLHDSIKWKRDISDEASKFYYAVMKEDENDYKKFMNNLNNEDLLFFFLKDANQKKLYLLDSDSKFIFFYYFKN